MASSSCAFTPGLRSSLAHPLPLRRSLPTSQSILPKPPALIAASRIGVKRKKKLELRASSSVHEITTEKAKGKVRVSDSEDSLAVSLAEYTADLSDKFARERGAFTVVLSGGSLIKSLRKLVVDPFIDTVEWSKWHVFWVDERVVPKDHKDSNYKLAYDSFLSKVPIPPGNLYAINDALSAEGAADDYESRLKHLVKTNIIDVSQATGLPKFDLMLLGMGPDGHVASLFPRHPLVQANKQWVAFIKDSPKPPPERITFTFPVINSSANIALVAAGAGKASIVNEALGGDDLSSDAQRIEMIKAGRDDVVNVAPCDDESSDLLPVEMVSPEGELTWFLDDKAASDLLTCSYWMFA